MKKIYEVKRMHKDDYKLFQGGDKNVCAQYVQIEANNPEEAIKIAEGNMYVVFTNHVKTLEEIFAEEEAAKQEELAREQKEREAKAKKAEAEAKKAAAAGMTVEEYKKAKAQKTKIARVKREIAELEEELANKQKYLKKLEKAS